MLCLLPGLALLALALVEPTLLLLGVFLGVSALIQIPFQRQIVVTEREVSIRKWWDVFRDNPGIVRTLGPESRLIRHVSGALLLAGSEVTPVRISSWYPVSWLYEPRLMAACRRAGVQVVDKVGDWRRAHPLRRRVQIVLLACGGFSLLLAFGVSLIGDFEATKDPVFALFVAGGGLSLAGWLAGPPDYRPVRKSRQAASNQPQS